MDDALKTGINCAAWCNVPILSVDPSNHSLRIHFCTSTYQSLRSARGLSVSSRNEYFRTLNHNSLLAIAGIFPSNSESLPDSISAIWKPIAFLQYCCCSACRAPFFEFHLCLSRTVKNMAGMKFLSRSLFHREHTSILILPRPFDSSPFFLLSCFTFICSILMVETEYGSRRYLMSTSYVIFRRDDKRRENCAVRTLYFCFRFKTMVIFSTYYGIY